MWPYLQNHQQNYQQKNGRLNICHILGFKDRKLRSYEWITRDDLPKDDIFLVKFAGFGLTAVRRDIVESIPFAGDGVFKGKGMEFGASLDFVFCWTCHENEVPIYVDKRIDMEHLRSFGTFNVGIKKPVEEILLFSEEIKV